MEYAKIFSTSLPFFFTCFLIIPFFWLKFFCNKGGQPSSLPRSWPVFGTILSLLSNLHRLADFAVEVMQQSHGTFMFKGPWFTKMELLATADPSNVQYIMSKHHDRFNRGPNFEEIFVELGEGIFNSDHDKWRYQKKIALDYFTDMGFRRFMDENITYKIESGLIPLLERSSTEGSIIDLQDIFERFTGDVTWMLLIGHDPKFLSWEDDHQSSIHHIRDLSHTVAEATISRHILPPCIWKLLMHFRIGKERATWEFREAINSFIFGFIRNKRHDMMKGGKKSLHEGDGRRLDLFSYYMKENYGTKDHGFKSVDVFLRDTFTNFLFAGQDTVSAALAWFFWLIIRHPKVEAKILEELRYQIISQESNISQLNDPNNLVYLHAALYEALRLYPPVPYNHRSPKKTEVLPSGHTVKPNTMIILCTYAMGRMSWVWGDDCDEFKPERWITEQGKIKHEPSYKFFSFNSGARFCLGKDMSMIQMKAVVSAILLHSYRFQLVEGHRADTTPSVVLRMKHGLKVKIAKCV